MTTTKVINFFAGSGAGKSTTAAQLFAEMKLLGLDVELVREYVKDWAWSGRKIGPYDQLYIFGKQAHAEAEKYNIIEYICTDSPILLAPFYEEYYLGRRISLPSALEFIKYAQENGVQYYNFFLERTKPFNPRGRYETEEQARKIDVALKQWLHNINMPFTVVSSSDRERVGYILSSLGINTALEAAQGTKPGEVN